MTEVVRRLAFVLPFNPRTYGYVSKFCYTQAKTLQILFDRGNKEIIKLFEIANFLKQWPGRSLA